MEYRQMLKAKKTSQDQKRAYDSLQREDCFWNYGAVREDWVPVDRRIKSLNVSSRCQLQDDKCPPWGENNFDNSNKQTDYQVTYPWTVQGYDQPIRNSCQEMIRQYPWTWE
eukprot:TRINITY_DN9376_c0_g1_i4.p4 TRINITY_DN9376_c0_g1~~TRINITY_DN9376_c0_g1_i4.p4  ORF type:complete len:111 (-),score=9.18 TRINITY_DN9376_c0_g1_i4:143-475(-)